MSFVKGHGRAECSPSTARTAAWYSVAHEEGRHESVCVARVRDGPRDGMRSCRCWYFVHGTFSATFSAAVSVGERAPDIPGQVTAVRWSLLGDAIDFQRSFDFSFEYVANSPPTALDHSSVAVYYSK